MSGVVTAAAVEAAAEHFYMSGPGGSEIHWDDLPRQRKTYFRRRARAALEAAAPHIANAVWDDCRKSIMSKSCWAQ